MAKGLIRLLLHYSKIHGSCRKCLRVLQSHIFFPDEMETCSNSVWYVISKSEPFPYSKRETKIVNSPFHSYTSKDSLIYERIPYDIF